VKRTLIHRQLLRPKFWSAALVAGLIVFAPTAHAAESGVTFDGAGLSLIWALPFAGLLLSIALFPLLAPRFWHHHDGKIAGFWAVATLLPLGFTQGTEIALSELLHVAIFEYIPFILLLVALFTSTGGIRLEGRIGGTPTANTVVLALGALLASFIGTTGAAMLLIRPLIESNEGRKYQTHIVVFFIFLVANIGGSLTPLGDAPLFLGYLNGVDFLWPTEHLFLPLLFVATPLLGIFFIIDWLAAGRDEVRPEPEAPTRFRAEGLINFVILGLILLAVALSGSVVTGISLRIASIDLPLEAVLRDLAMAGLALASWRLTPTELHRRNFFTWLPIAEVAKIFAAIFITIIPPLAILRAGAGGAAAPLLSALAGNGQPNDLMYFWITGALSSFLDNAPTYLIFFNAAGGDAGILMEPLAGTLLAISTGAVFMGAMTYIGNAPNFMVRSIAEARGVKMPGFFSFMLWSCVILLPIFLVFSLLFFRLAI
jgi:Na+/H+ antiporter NhaD/arsenite permease-like protein